MEGIYKKRLEVLDSIWIKCVANGDVDTAKDIFNQIQEIEIELEIHKKMRKIT